MDEIDVAQYFLCPISRQIMKDPVTTVTGITYDRESIEQWLTTAAACEDAVLVCPVTKLPLSQSPDLTPNHMLRRLIEAWRVANCQSRIDRIPTPKSSLHESMVFKLIREVNNRSTSLLNIDALKKMEELANESEMNQKCMAEAGVAKSMIFFILRCFDDVEFFGVDHALKVLRLTWIPTMENKKIVEENSEFFRSILWVLNSDVENSTKTLAVFVLKKVTEVSSSSILETLNPSFITEMMKFLRKNISPQATKAILQILIEICPLERNTTKIVEAGAVFELIEMELGNPEKKTTELIFCLLAHLCSCADGRQQFLRHAGGVAMVAKRLLRVSPATDDWALCILESIAPLSAMEGVAAEILAVGGVSKLCMVLQVDCEGFLKKKAREILRLHSDVWSCSPCMQFFLLPQKN